MSKLKIVCSILMLVLSFALSNHLKVLAHPGNTSSDGGHYCWTRCDYWGEVYGQRHFHNGSGTVEPDPSEYDPPDEPDYEPSDYDSSDSYSAESTPPTQADTSTSDSPKKGCYIATASYGDYEATDVRYLRSYRDEVLEKTQYGKIFVSEYYKYSPYAASVIEKNELLKFVVRETQIKPIVNLLRIVRK